MIRRPLALALVAALLSAPVAAEDLVQTYEMARANDPQLSISESSRLRSREGQVQARGAMLPQLSGSVGLNRDYVAGVGGHDSSRSYGAQLSQSLVNLGQIASLRAARDISQAADYDLAAANDNLIVRTAQAYFNVLVALETLAAAEAAEQAFQKQFDFADKRLEVGLAPITDVHEARAQYDAARANTLQSRTALQDAYQALAEITGTPVPTMSALPDDFKPELPAGATDAQAWVDIALDNNPSLRAAQYASQASEHNVNAARAQHLPSLGLSARYSNGTSWTSTAGSLSRDSEGTSVGLTLNVPIFAGGVTQSRVRQAIADRDIALDQQEQLRRSIERNTRTAYQTLVAGVTEVEARRLALVSAQSAYDASQVGLEVGTRTVIDVLINQQNLLSARRAYAQAKYNHLFNHLLLEQATGRLDASHVQDINRLLTVQVSPLAALQQ